MLSRPDTQSFSKFLASAGALLCVLAFVAPTLVIRDTATLRVTDAELQALTPAARAEVLRRQRLSEDTARAAVPAGGVALVLGLGLLGTGLCRLKKQEDRDDELAVTALKKAKVELADLTPAEREEQTNDEVKLELSANASTKPVEPTVPDGTPAQPAQSPNAFESLREQLAAIEGEVFRRVKELTPRSHRFRAHVKALLEPPIRIDALLRSPPGHGPDLLLEVGVVRDVSKNRASIRMRVDRVVATTTVYRESVDGTALAWLVIVLQSQDGPKGSDSSVADWVRERVATPAWLTVTVVDRAEIDALQLPAAFGR